MALFFDTFEKSAPSKSGLKIIDNRLLCTFQALNRHNSTILVCWLKPRPPFCLSWQADPKHIQISRDRQNGHIIIAK